jgi:hypothetical protein
MGMRLFHAVLTVLVFSCCLRLPAQETVPERCHAPNDSLDNQPMPEQFTIPHTPKTARQVSCFVSFKENSPMLDVVT